MGRAPIFALIGRLWLWHARGCSHTHQLPGVYVLTQPLRRAPPGRPQPELRQQSWGERKEENAAGYG